MTFTSNSYTYFISFKIKCMSYFWKKMAWYINQYFPIRALPIYMFSDVVYITIKAYKECSL